MTLFIWQNTSQIISDTFYLAKYKLFVRLYTAQNRKLLYKNGQKYHVTHFLTPSHPHVLFGDTVSRPPTPLESVTYYLNGQYHHTIRRCRTNLKKVKKNIIWCDRKSKICIIFVIQRKCVFKKITMLLNKDVALKRCRSELIVLPDQSIIIKFHLFNYIWPYFSRTNGWKKKMINRLRLWVLKRCLR